MNKSFSTHRWRVISESVRGTAHERAGTPNQDSVWPEPGASDGVAITDTNGMVIAAVADGHGSKKSFRSDRGSRFATKSAFKALEEMTVKYLPRDGVSSAQTKETSELHAFVQTELLQRIVGYWRQEVADDLRVAPITASELDPLSSTERDAVNSNNYTAYGTTLIAVLFMPSHAVYLQLGDGDILVVPDDGSEASRPLPPDDRSFANETASLSSKGNSSSRRPGGEPTGPWGDFRVRVVPTEANVPALVLLTTDGYANAFVADAGFRKAAIDLLSIGRQESWEYVRTELRGWLEEASRKGSGDDVTVAILVRDSDSSQRLASGSGSLDETTTATIGEHIPNAHTTSSETP